MLYRVDNRLKLYMIKTVVILFNNNIDNCCYYIYICINTYYDDINPYNCILYIMIKIGYIFFIKKNNFLRNLIFPYFYLYTLYRCDFCPSSHFIHVLILIYGC